MLILTKGVAGQTFIVTLNEAKTLASPWYLFRIASVGTSDLIEIVYNWAADMSAYPERFNEFAVDETLFTAATVGQYKYDIYEAAVEAYGDYTTLNKIESGQLEIKPATPINRKGYEATTSRKKGYAG